jgi:uroporphyrin-3 C-methyltransferase
MNAESGTPVASLATQEAQPDALRAPAHPIQRSWLLWGGTTLAVVALIATSLLWQKLASMQEQLARQSADSAAQATQAAVMARQAQDVAIQTAAKLAVAEARLSEVSLQRTQLEELMQSLSRSRDENLVVDIESAVRLAQQQAQLTGSAEPLLAALRSAEVRIARAAQPRLTALQRVIARDVARIKATVLADTPTLLVKLDELVLLADELPVANAVATVRGSEPLKRKPDEAVSTWWVRLGMILRDEIRGLVRVGRVEVPEAALLSPEQAFFLRENLKLKLLNARLGLLSRQVDSARSDLATAADVLNRYFDGGSRKTQTTATLLHQVQGQMKTLELPRIDETLAALTMAASGR